MLQALGLFAASADGAMQRLGERIYPPATFLEEERKRQHDALRETQMAQPAIGAVSLGLYHLLRHFGVEPALVGGHSFGELLALHAAGRIDEQAFVELSVRRGALMAACASGDDPSSMLAVFAAPDHVAKFLQEHTLDLVIANTNAPAQCVLSGPIAEINRAVALLSSAKITTRPLAVAAAFHSRFVASASDPLRQTLSTVAFSPARLPVFANATAEIYPEPAEEARELLASQLARPVQFVAQVEAMYRSGARTFLEVGPGARLSGMVAAILEGRPHQALAVDASGGEGDDANLADLASALASLAALGYPVELSRWDEGFEAKTLASPRSRLSVKVCGANAAPRLNGTAKATVCAENSAPADGRPRGPQPLLLAQSPASGFPQSVTPSSTNLPSERIMTLPQRNSHPVTNGQPAPPASNAVRRDHERSGAQLHSTVSSPPNSELARAIEQTQENLLTLQRLAEQTAQLHRQFLEGQAAAQQTFHALLSEHQRLTSQALGQHSRVEQKRPTEDEHRDVAPRGSDLPGTVPPATTMDESPAGDQHSVPAARNGDGPAIAPTPAPVHTAPAATTTTPATTPPAAARILLEVVAEKTGYPKEMLELDMQLDSDLGIDSIKRVEILSALQDRIPEAPVVGPEQIGTLRTLRQIAEFLQGPNQAQVQPSPRPAEPARNGDAHSNAPADPLAPSSATVAVSDVLLSIVAEKTGYPQEMLELDMQLDADLGIDSIKRVEILSALQDRIPEAPVVGPEQIGILRTLRQIAEFLQGQVQPSPRPAEPARNGDAHFHSLAEQVAPPASVAAVSDVLLSIVAEKTGYPQEMLELDMQLDADLGIDSIKRVEILSAVQDRIPEAPVVGPEQIGTLRTLRQIAEFLERMPQPAAEASQPPALEPIQFPARQVLDCWTPRAVPLAASDQREPAAIAQGSEIWISDDGSQLPPALQENLTRLGYHARLIALEGSPLPDPAMNLGALIVLASPEAAGALIPNALRLVRAAGPALRRQGLQGGSALLSVSRLDGSFGLGQGGIKASLDVNGGALAGLVKTAQQEWPEVHCKALDVDPSFDSVQAAQQIVQELMRRGPVEVGICGSAHQAIELLALPGATRIPRREPLTGPGELVIASGGARGITAEVAVALAEALRPRLALLGRTPAPQSEPSWLVQVHGETALRRAIHDHAEGPLSPSALNEKVKGVLAQREIRRNLERITAAGSDVSYHALDVRDRAAVSELAAMLQRQHGPVRGLIHGAGVLADRHIEDQTDLQFAQVFETKVGGLLGLVDGIDQDKLRFLALFSSSSARFGRVGQAAYAVANEWLNKWAQRTAREHPHCRVVAFNWGPWDGGMVTGALKPMFQREGLGLIQPAEGARLLVEEIQAGGDRPVEIVVLARPEAPGQELETLSQGNGHAAVASAPRDTGESGTMEPVFARRVDLDSLPVLRSHVIDGHAVLPLALILEWLAEGALHRHPGMVVRGLDDLRLYKGLVLRGGQPADVSIRVGKLQRRGEHRAIPVEMQGLMEGGREIKHARAEVIIAEAHGVCQNHLVETSLPPLEIDRVEIYGRILFHGPALQAIGRVEGCSEQAIAGWVSTAPAPSAWALRPLRQSWLTDPLAIDAAFQLLVLWTRQRLGASSLPTAVGSYRQFRRAFPSEGVRVRAAVRELGDHRASADIDFADAEGKLVARIEAYECVIDASLNQAFRRNRLSELEVASSP
jgi:acyl transferase domain-containing protein/NAD(P)-dependent dehydrogenase (short-subunit alcohol dehydrogenase family)